MISSKRAKLKLQFKPLTKENWEDFERLFGPRGACGGCWCMLWRLTHSEFERLKGDGTHKIMHRIVLAGQAPGLLAYSARIPVGWCAVAPREHYPRLGRSRVLKRIDAAPVWSISCLYVARSFRGMNLSVQLLKASARHVRDRGGKIVEGYPIEPRNKAVPDVFAHTGVACAFLKAGFVECARGAPTRPIMRLNL